MLGTVNWRGGSALPTAGTGLPEKAALRRESCAADRMAIQSGAYCRQPEEDAENVSEDRRI